MTWNVRAMQHEKNGETWVSLHEVYYSEAGKLTGFTVDPVIAIGSDEKELRWYVERMLEALDKPVLVPEDFSTLLKEGKS